ncbi:tyrosine-type recombinase/integrase [Couchioplanes caeruleus]|uniref:tyrosine-type recombinase/integrase n=1 Tax=Couchioplanes caeruleus TaxID=56438 RepID=UPI001FD3DE93|nr:tyrosine-type recombinase/integrase [Couchioplanes caeruleus]
MEDAPEELRKALAWLEKASVPLSDLVKAETTRAALAAVALNMDGKAAAATTYRRKRSVFYNVLQYAVELELLDFNPVDKLRVTANRKKVVEAVDRRSVVNPRQARELLAAVSYVGSRGKDGKRGERLVAFFASYFAALRPGDALGLRVKNCHLPQTGWGSVTVERSPPAAGKRYTDSGEVHDDRGLKHRGEDDAPTLPIPPQLVVILREHINRFKVTDYLLRSAKGMPVSPSSYVRVWREARRLALTPAQVDSPLAARPYDLRHAGVSLWLNAGVNAPEVADRAGHSVDVLLKVYAKCIDGDTKIMNERDPGFMRDGDGGDRI